MARPRAQTDSSPPAAASAAESIDGAAGARASGSSQDVETAAPDVIIQTGPAPEASALPPSDGPHGVHTTYGAPTGSVGDTVESLVEHWYRTTNTRWRNLPTGDRRAKAALVELIRDFVAHQTSAL